MSAEGRQTRGMLQARRLPQAHASLHAHACSFRTPARCRRLQEAAAEAAEEGERLLQQLGAGEISVEAFVER